jgi:hypothetical protein
MDATGNGSQRAGQAQLELARKACRWCSVVDSPACTERQTAARKGCLHAVFQLAAGHPPGTHYEQWTVHVPTKNQANSRGVWQPLV